MQLMAHFIAGTPSSTGRSRLRRRGRGQGRHMEAAGGEGSLCY